MRSAPLADVLDTVIDHRGKTPRKLGGDFQAVGVPVISAISVKDGRVVQDREGRFVSESIYRKWMPVPCRAGDVVLTSEAPLGQVAQILSDAPLVLGQRVYALRGKPGVMDNDFLYYALQWSQVQDALRARATGTTVVGIRQSELLRVEVPVPPLDVQRAVVETLRAFDDKIALNRSITELSWSLARAYFEDLRDRTEAEVLVRDVAELEYGKALPARVRVDGSIPVYGSGGVVGTHSEPLLTGPGIIVGRKGTVGAVHWSHGPFYPIDTTFYVRPLSDRMSLLYLYFSLSSLGLEQMNSDSAVPGLNRHAAARQVLRLPTAEEQAEFDQRAMPLVDAAHASERESAALRSLRDVLLPQLLDDTQAEEPNREIQEVS